MKKSLERIDVLHVDDDPATTGPLSESLKDADERIAVQTATTIAEGQEILAAGEIDGLVAEHNLPDGTGIEFLESVRERQGDLPFILYTDSGSEAVASEAISAGVTDYVRKDAVIEQSGVVANKVVNAVEARQAQREHHRQLDAIESAQEGISILDEDGQFIFVNEAYAELYGYEPEQMLGEHWELVYPEEDIPEIYEDVLSTVKDEGFWEGQTTGLRADGATFTEEHILALTGGNELVCTVRDITERKQREQEIERTRDLLERTERLADVGGWELDAETMDMFWTDHLFDIMGVSAETVPPLEEALEIYHEDDRSTVREAVEKALEDGEPFDIEVRFERPDGEKRWLQVQGTPTLEDGKVVTLRGAVKDVTEQRSREQVLREMYEIISDRDQGFEGKVQALLDLGQRELGTKYGTLSRIEEEEYLFEVVAGEDEQIRQGNRVPVEATNCERVAETERTIVLGDIERDAPEEVDRTGYTEMGICSYIGAPVYVEDAIHGTFCFYDTEARSEDFSEWEQTLVDLMSRWVGHELQRRETTERLQAKNKQLEQFASIVSHDLRNPLNVASLRLNLAMEESESEHLREVKNAHERMEELIEDLLSLALEGEAVSETEPVEISEVVEHCRQTVDTRSGTIEMCDSRTVKADRGRLQQLVENLIRNAVDHGGDDVTISVGVLESGFYIEDDGAGIELEDHQTVFEPGFSTVDDGTGFGLSIVKQVADAHGWGLAVTEGSAGGARFEVTGVEFVNED